MSAAACALAERRAALQVAAAALRSRVTPVEVGLHAIQGPNLCSVVACWRWPGVLRIRSSHTGRLIARALSGQPQVFDEVGTRDEQPRAEHPFANCLFTSAERLSVLQAGAERLQDRERLPRVLVTVRMAGRDIRAEAVWHWPGIVVLEERESRTLLAQSVPGKPGELDESAQ